MRNNLKEAMSMDSEGKKRLIRRQAVDSAIFSTELEGFVFKKKKRILIR